jgi:hypothetical protein
VPVAVAVLYTDERNVAIEKSKGAEGSHWFAIRSARRGNGKARQKMSRKSVGIGLLATSGQVNSGSPPRGLVGPNGWVRSEPS